MITIIQFEITLTLLVFIGQYCSSFRNSFTRRSSVFRIGVSGIYDDHDTYLDDVSDGLRYYREYVKRGMQRFMNHDLQGAEADFNMAKEFNNTQPLIQRGIALYCNGKYDAAAEQFGCDIKYLENLKIVKSSDLRLWKSACLRKLGYIEEADNALDLNNIASYGISEGRYLMNNTLNFYAGQRSIEDMLDIVGSGDEKDFLGVRFFGNFYIGLYYHSIGNMDFAKLFLEIPASCDRYSDKDMWYHVPRVLYEATSSPSEML
eukprot:gene1898-3675_t